MASGRHEKDDTRALSLGTKAVICLSVAAVTFSLLKLKKTLMDSRSRTLRKTCGVLKKVSSSRRVAIVTGAASGIGRATALRFLELGYSVACVDINVGAMRSLRQEIESSVNIPNENVHYLTCNLAIEEQVKNVVRSTVSHFGRLDAAFNNAGIEGVRASISDLSVDDYDAVMNTNARSVFLCMKYEIEQMLIQKTRTLSAEANLQNEDVAPIDRFGYTIVNSASTAGLSSMPEFSAYCASKHAIVGLTKCAAKEYANSGIRCNAICPSTVATPMVARFQHNWPTWQRKQNASFPVGRVGRASEIANAVAWLCSSQCPFLTGEMMIIDGASSA